MDESAFLGSVSIKQYYLSFLHLQTAVCYVELHNGTLGLRSKDWHREREITLLYAVGLCSVSVCNNKQARGLLQAWVLSSAQRDFSCCSAMAYLHGLDILHGDLSGNNILLACNSDDERGFTAKVADFGLARMLGEGEVVQTRAIGTITHMPPELMLEGMAIALRAVVTLWARFACCSLILGHALHAVSCHSSRSGRCVGVQHHTCNTISVSIQSMVTLACFALTIKAWPRFACYGPEQILLRSAPSMVFGLMCEDKFLCVLDHHHKHVGTVAFCCLLQLTNI